MIHGAAGNVGAYAVQFAREAGLQTVCTASPDDVDRVVALGGDRVIDFTKTRFEDEVRGVDAVIDLVGGETQTRSFQVLKNGGKLISAVSVPDQDLAARARSLGQVFSRRRIHRKPGPYLITGLSERPRDQRRGHIARLSKLGTRT